MIPFGSFTWFGLLLYAIIPTILLGLVPRFHRWSRHWLLLVTAGVLTLEFSSHLAIRPNWEIREIWIVLGYALFQSLLATALLRWKSLLPFPLALTLSLLPLLVAKLLPDFSPDSAFGFLGISYLTFRALDVLFSIHDGIIKTLPLPQYFAFLLFFPTASSGPIDRYRRFIQDWEKLRSQDEFLADLDFCISRIFRGFLYKFIIAALIHAHWITPIAKIAGIPAWIGLMYAETFYLFFDFAGYSAFAIGISRLLGIHTPENFRAPFLSQNIREFWTRWHISLSFWFRDHVHMRFLLAAMRGRWFTGKHTANYLGLFLTFILMGLWHGFELRYLVYGIYHASLLCAFDLFSRWNKQARVWKTTRPAQVTSIVLTFHSFAFGIMIFNGYLTPRVPPLRENLIESCDAQVLTGVVWDRTQPNATPLVDIYVDGAWVDEVIPNEFREDLRERGLGNGRHGLTYHFKPDVQTGRAHSVAARIRGKKSNLDGSPVIVVGPRESTSVTPPPPELLPELELLPE